MVNPVYIIAEAGVNHNGSLDMARQLVAAAAKAGADAVKFQTFKAERGISRMAPKAEYQLKTTSDGESQLSMVKKLELDEAAHRVLMEDCKKNGIHFLSTPFDLESVDLLVRKFNLPRLKIPSGELTHAQYLLKIARTGKPVIVSTGMCRLDEVGEALGILAFGYLEATQAPSLAACQRAYSSGPGRRVLREKVTLLHCTTEYPCPMNEVNLRAMNTLATTFGLPIGLSDHSQGIVAPIAAVAMGAVMIEKHFTLDRSLPGPDHKASLTPQELAEMVRSIRDVQLALGDGNKAPTASEFKNQAIARKSLVAATIISKGETFTESNVTAKRPGTGISPLRYWECLGKVARRDIMEDELLLESDV